jgi:hypothetical protein
VTLEKAVRAKAQKAYIIWDIGLNTVIYPLLTKV